MTQLNSACKKNYFGKTFKNATKPTKFDNFGRTAQISEENFNSFENFQIKKIFGKSWDRFLVGDHVEFPV